MDNDMVRVAERLVDEFPDVPCVVVVQAVCSCLDECSSQSPFFVEQAARAHLCALKATVERPDACLAGDSLRPAGRGAPDTSGAATRQ